MKRLGKVFLSFVLVMMCAFSFVGCKGDSDTDFDGTYYFNREYYYENDNPSEKFYNELDYGDWYGKSIKIEDNYVFLEVDGEAIFYKLVKDGKKYKLIYTYGYDEDDRPPIQSAPTMSVAATYAATSQVQEEVSEVVGDRNNKEVETGMYLEYSKGVVTISGPLEEDDDSETMVLEFLKDKSKVVTHDYRRGNRNDFIDINGNELVIIYEGCECRYNMENEGDFYTLTLLSESEDVLFETATLQIKENKLIITYDTDKVREYNKL